MKKYMVMALCFINYINSMEPQASIEKIEITKKQRKRQDYDVEMCNKRGVVCNAAFLQWLQNAKIDTENKMILNIGCCTGHISKNLAKTATYVHGYDENKNMIIYAQNTFKDIKNLSFEHIKIKHFKSDKQYDVAIIPFGMNHWGKNREKILCTMSKSIKMNGDFFAALVTNENPKPFQYVAGEKLVHKYISSHLSMEKLAGWECLSNDELINLFNKIGFEIITIEEQSISETMNINEFKEEMEWTAKTTPLMKFIPDNFIEKYKEKYLNLCIEELSPTDKDKDEYTYKIFLTVVHARKIKNLL